MADDNEEREKQAVQDEAAEAALAKAAAIDENASFGIEEGEVNKIALICFMSARRRALFYFVCAQVDGLEKKWNTWSFDVEENKRLVLDEVADVGATPQRMSVWGGSGSPRGGGGGTRARRRTAWGEYLVKASPVYFGWIVAGLVAVCALIVSPAQVYCVGVVVDFMAIDLSLSRLELSTVYATAALLSAPLITLHPLVLKRISRRLLISLCGGGVIGGILLVAAASGRVTLLLAWTLLLAVGPGMLYPAAESVLLDWWHAKRARVQCGVQAAAALLGMIILPALLAAGVGGGCSGCSVSNLEPCGCWRGAYSALGASLALPVAVIAALFLEGGAADHDLHLDDMGAREDRSGLLGGGGGGGGGGGDGVEMAAVPEPSDAPPADAAEANGEQQQQHTPPMAQRTNGRRRRSNRLLTPRELWALHDVLTHTTFWLAQVSISTVQALVAAFLFHRTHIAATHFDPNASGTTPPEAGLVELVVGLLTAVCSPLNLIIRRKEYLVLIAMSLACLGMFILASSSGVGALNLAALLLGMAFGVTNAYATTLWEYFYGDSDAHRIKQISVAIATGAHTHIAKQITASKHACTYIHTPHALLLVCMYVSPCAQPPPASPSGYLQSPPHAAPTTARSLAAASSPSSSPRSMSPRWPSRRSSSRSCAARQPGSSSSRSGSGRPTSRTRGARSRTRRGWRGSCARRRRAEGRRRTSDGSMRRWSRRIWRIR